MNLNSDRIRRWVGSRSTLLVLASLLSGTRAAWSGAMPVSPLSEAVVHIYPAITRDDDTAFLYNRGFSPLQFAFYTRDKPLDFSQATLTVDLPSSLKIHSVAVIQGWRLQKKIAAEAMAGAAAGFTRWKIPLPAKTDGKLVPGKWVSWTGNYCVAFVTPAATTPAATTPAAGDNAKKLETPQPARCILSGVRELQGEAAGFTTPVPSISTESLFKVALLPRPAKRPNPKRIPLWISQRWAAYMDSAEFDDNLRLMRELGVTQIDVQKATLVPDAAQRWRKAGISFYEKFRGVIIPGAVTVADKYDDANNYFVGLDGRNVQGTRKYRQTPFCPSAMADPQSALFKDILAQAEEVAAQGVEYLYSDHELDVFAYCFCPRCRTAFAKQAGVPLEEALDLPPLELMRRHTLAWYKFRSWQSAQMILRLKEKTRDKFPNLKIGLNDGLTYFNQEIEGLGYGYSMFAEDMRIVDDAVDFHNLDALHNSVNDVARLATAQPEKLRKPVIPRVAGSYSLGWEQGQISARWAYSKQIGRKLGYNQRPQLQRLAMISHIASGARGLEMFVGAHESDAAVANATDDALAVIARMEDVYLDGQRDDNCVEVVDVTQTPSPFLQDDGIFSGDVWAKEFWPNYGGPYWRVHHWRNRTFISLFNWDPAQSKEWIVRLPQAREPGVLADVLQQQVWNGPQGAAWAVSELKAGWPVRVPPLQVRVLELSPSTRDVTWSTITLNKTERQDWLKRAQRNRASDQRRYQRYPLTTQNRQGLTWRLETTVRDWLKRGLVDKVEGWTDSPAP